MTIAGCLLVLIAITYTILGVPSEDHEEVEVKTRWYQEFNRTVIKLKQQSALETEDQERLYNLWHTGLVYNLWIGLPNIEACFIMAYRLVSDNPKIFLRMKAKLPSDRNPFRRYYLIIGHCE